MIAASRPIAPTPRRSRSASFVNSSPVEAFESIRADYSAAKSSRYRRRRMGVSSSGSGADYHYRSEADYLRMMEQARDMDRNDCIVGQTVDRAVTNIVQGGFTLDPLTGDDALDIDLYERFEDWSSDPEQCDVAGEMCFYDMECMVKRSELVDGDILALPLREGPLQLVEAHRLRTPRNTKLNVVHGIVKNEVRRSIQYWLTNDDIDPMKSLTRVGDVTQYRARDDFGNRQVFHIYNPKRVTQTRGVTAFAPIFDCLGMIEDINFAKLVQQQIVSCFAIFRMREALDNPGGSISGYGETTTEQTPAGTRTLEGIAPGMEVTGEPGEKLEGFSPHVPNAEYFQHVKLILTFVGINLGLPLVLVLLDASETNFSGWRGAVDQARLGFRRNQKCLVNKFHSPVYKWKVRQWIEQDAALKRASLRGDVKIFKHAWNVPGWPYVDPLKDASADLLRMRNGLASPRRIHSERGHDFQEEAIHTVKDNAFQVRAAKREAMAINKEFDDGSPVEWRQLISLPTPDGVSVKLTEPASIAETQNAA